MAREQLLKASLKIFAQKGYDGATVKDIADAAKVNVSLISYHFGGKQKLYRACLEGIAEERLQFAQRTLRPCKTKDEFCVRLRVFAEDFIRGHIQNPDAMTIVHRDFENGQPVVCEIFSKVFAELFENFSSFLKSGMQASILRSDLDPAATTMILIGALIHTVRIDAVRPGKTKNSIRDKKFFERYLDQYIAIFSDGILRGER